MLRDSLVDPCHPPEILANILDLSYRCDILNLGLIQVRFKGRIAVLEFLDIGYRCGSKLDDARDMVDCGLAYGFDGPGRVVRASKSFGPLFVCLRRLKAGISHSATGYRVTVGY